MKAIFSKENRHRITLANNNFYGVPFEHPERIMNEHDFVYIVQGTWKIGQNSKVYSLKKDNLLILSAGERHYGVTPCTAGTKTMYFHVTKEAGDKSGTAPVADAYVADTLTDASANPSIKRYFEHVVANKISGNEDKANLYFELLLCEIEESRMQSAPSDVAEKIKNIIHTNPEKFYSNEALADMAKVSVKTAENKFKSATGKTIHRYMLEFKIDEAISCFKLFPEMSIKETACNLGFYDEYHFSRQFKKFTGVSPAVYRKKY